MLSGAIPVYNEARTISTIIKQVEAVQLPFEKERRGYRQWIRRGDW
jgi:hypothetical protein